MGGFLGNQEAELLSNLSKSINALNESLKENSETSYKLQKWLIFWTAIMAIAVVGQIIAIILTTFF